MDIVITGPYTSAASERTCLTACRENRPRDRAERTLMSESVASGSTPEIQKLRLWNFPITLRNWLALKFPLGMPDGERDGIDVPVELRDELNAHGWPEVRTDRVKWAEVMRDFAISRNTARRWVRVGIMPGVETPKGIVIPRVLYDAWYAWIREESARRPR